MEQVIETGVEVYSDNSIRQNMLDKVMTPQYDPFEKSVAELRGYVGLNAQVKRRATNELNKFLRGKTGVPSKQVEFESLNGYGMFRAVPPPYDLMYLAKLYEISSYNYGAINAKVANTVALGYDFVESPKMQEAVNGVTDSGKLDKIRRKVEKGRRELFEWLDGCNEDSLFTETLTKFYTDYETTGNGYLEVGRTTSGQIQYLGHIPSTTMRVRAWRDGYVQIVSNKITFFRNFQDSTTPDQVGDDPQPNEVIHLKNYSPINSFYGVPDIIAAKVAMAGNEFAGRYNLDYFEHKAVPRYVIVIKGAVLSDRSRSELLEFFQSGLKGKNHRSIIVPLPADDPNNKVEFKMEPVEVGTQEGSFNQYRNANRDEILMAHRVPISKIGIPEGIGLAEALAADKTFKEQVTRPMQQIIEKKINRIVGERSDALILKLNELSLTDEDLQSQIDERYLRMQVLTPNEVRARKGMASIEGGDKVVDLKPQQPEQKAQATGNRVRDQKRTAGATDSKGAARNAKGTGRKTP